MDNLPYMMFFACIVAFHIVNGVNEFAFLIVPQNATALEGSIHTFECATNNPNFSILWFVDNTNAHYERVRVRGFKSHYINQTFERLTALASLRNNNSSIDCLAVRPPGKGSFLRYDAERVYFMVKALSSLVTTSIGPVTAVSITPSSCSTASSCLSDSKGVAFNSLLSGATSSRTVSHSTPTPQHSLLPLQPSPWTSRDQPVLRGSKKKFPFVVVCTASLVPILVVMCLSALLLLLGMKKWQRRAITHQDPETSPNVLYEVHKPMKCKGNQAYETVSATAPPWPVEMDSIALQVQASPDELHVYDEI